jgi:ABC-2 type transport system ATP-binding protein
MDKVIEFENVSKTYNLGLGKAKLPVLFDVSFSVNSGEIFGFVGPNGAGKSTTIKLIMNLIFPDKGRVSVFGDSPKNIENKKNIGYLPEIPYYFDYLTPEELAWFSGKIAGLSDGEIKKRTDELISKLLFEEHRKKKIKELSKGNAQKAGIIATFIHEPKLFILDEPMTGLDPIGRKLVGDLILEYKKRGHTIFLTSHILSDVERFCDKIAIIFEGRIKACDTKDALLSSGKSLEDIFCKIIGLDRAN